MIRRVGGGGGGGGLRLEDHQFLATNYGYKADGSSSDSEAINDTITAAAAWADDVDASEVHCLFPVSEAPAILDLATIKGGTTKGNAQVPSPLWEDTRSKLLIKLMATGNGESGNNMHWNQLVGQRWGVTWKSTLTGQTVDSNWGPPSIIGGPAITGALSEYGQSNGATFNNVTMVIEGIGLSYPLNPSVMGMDLAGQAQCAVRRCAMAPDDDRLAIATTVPTVDHTIGLRGPDVGNNDYCVFSDLSIYGMYVGMKVPEHSYSDRVAIIYAHDGLVFGASLEGFHSSAMGAISVEGIVDVIRVYDSGGRAPVHIAALSTETCTGYDINDPNNCLRGEIHYNRIAGSLAVNGATEVRVLAQNSARGSVTAPAVPATTVALRNPFWRDAMVRVIGGTVTVIEVDGVTTGATAGEVFVPTGSTVTLTYSSAPTWTWRLT